MSKFLRGLGSFIAIVGVLLGFILALLVIYAVAGGGGVLLGLFVFPLTFGLVPFYTLFVYGSWNLLLINYGSLGVGWFLHWLADNLEKQPQVPEVTPEPIEPVPASESVPVPVALPEVDKTPQDNSQSVIGWVLLGLVVFVLVVMAASVQSSAVSTSTRAPTPTIAPTKTQLPRSTPTPKTVSLHACVTDSTIRIRRGPGTDYEVIGGLVSGTCMSVLGRNYDSTWVYMVADDNKTGWVAASLLTIEGDLKQVTVKAASGVVANSTLTNLQISNLAGTYVANHSPSTTRTSTPQPLANNFIWLCSDTSDRLGEYVSCKVPRAYCDYRPDVNGSPTFCDDKPYPNQDFQLVTWGKDWSNYDGHCLVISGYLETYRGVLQIEAVRRAQVSYCE